MKPGISSAVSFYVDCGGRCVEGAALGREDTDHDVGRRAGNRFAGVDLHALLAKPAGCLLAVHTGRIVRRHDLLFFPNEKDSPLKRGQALR